MSEHQHDEAHVQRAFDRARRVLKLLDREGILAASVTLYGDGSASFRLPGDLCEALDKDTEANRRAIIDLIGSERMVPVADPLSQNDAMEIHVCCMLGREKD
jgi:hypothetical protein